MQYLADTSDGAWAEFLRHEEIRDPADLVGVARRLWTVELPSDVSNAVPVRVEPTVSRGDLDSYPTCQAAARALRSSGAAVLRAPSAALVPGGARGQVTAGGLHEAEDRDGLVWVLIGTRPALRAWATADVAFPTARVLALVAHFGQPAVLGDELGQERRSGEDRRSGPDRRHASVVDLRPGAPTQRARSRKERRSGLDRRRGPQA